MSRHLRAADVGLYLLDERHVQRFGMPKSEYYFASPWRLWHIDWAYPIWGIAIEIEGGTFTYGDDKKSSHMTGVGYADNCRKYSILSLLGWIVIRVTTDMLDRGEAWYLIDAALELRKAIGPLAAQPLDVTDKIGDLIMKIGKPPSKAKKPRTPPSTGARATHRLST